MVEVEGERCPSPGHHRDGLQTHASSSRWFKGPQIPFGCDAEIIGASQTDQDFGLITGEDTAVCNAIPREVLTEYTLCNQYLSG